MNWKNDGIYLSLIPLACLVGITLGTAVWDLSTVGKLLILTLFMLCCVKFTLKRKSQRRINPENTNVKETIKAENKPDVTTEI